MQVAIHGRAALFGCLLVALMFAVHCCPARAQTFGVELQNSIMPASGGMAGASIARPQDAVSALNGNPSTLRQFRGTQVDFSVAWNEPTVNLTQTSNIPTVGSPLIEPFSAKSSAQGSAVGNIGISQELDMIGLPASFAVGFVTTAGGFVDYRQVPESRGSDVRLAVFSIPAAVSVDLGERMSVGASLALGIGFFDGPFVGDSGMSSDHSIRGKVGVAYQLTSATTLGAYYQTGESFQFDNAVLIDPGPSQENFDVNLSLPQNIGFGIANSRLMDGRLLIAVDTVYKLWDDAEFFSGIYDNQWVVQIGTQYTVGRYRLRAGYAWAENPIDQNPASNIGGVVPVGDLPAVRYVQGLFPTAGQHRITGGVGVVDVLPGIDIDLAAGGVFRNEQQLGEFTSTSVEGYWLVLGLTWRFGGQRDSCGEPGSIRRMPNCTQY